ncbi:M48 family metalloprotease [Candidatus Nitrotoga arctica]|uniref:Peptidase_M48 domain-containing protein n=1 Tax=Candidatus Nitrotoga arctica TaxID=453162 RepID=A0ABN8AKR9_9PROT|nr:M48 family metalloprotease [Candidatus Nitrotoga arctica]CAG9932234.1 Peptidase_M48 domain-containing protein [Candidatus Nitrotoga arctica]
MKNLLYIVLYAWSMLCRAEGLPDLGDASQEAMTPQQERKIGEQSMFEIRSDKDYLDDAEVNDYLNQLGYQLVSNSNEPGQTFEFFALNDNSINAFALPGGFIGVNTGLMLMAQSESELASVLGHEIAHVTQHHLARMVAGQKIDSVAAIAALAVAILAARSNPQTSQAAIVGMQASSIQRQLNFTRIHEQEADRIGLTTLQKAGFDPHAMPIFFERLQKSTRLLDNNMPSYLRTHPITSDRIADVANRVQQTSYRLVADSLNFQLVRAKLRAMQKNSQEAVSFFKSAIGEQKHGNQTAQRYGLVLALLRVGQVVRATQEFAPLQILISQNPMIATLAGQIRRTNKSNTGNTEFYRNATQNFPQHRALAYDYIELLLEANRFEDALKLLNEQIIAHPNDLRLHELQARNYAALGKRQEEHHALAYTYILRGNLLTAIEQLELAKGAGTDFHELSIIESELKQFKEIAATRGKKK